MINHPSLSVAGPWLEALADQHHCLLLVVVMPQDPPQTQWSYTVHYNMIPGGFWAHPSWRSASLRMSLHSDQKLITSGLYWRKKLPRWLWFLWKPLVWGSGPLVLSCIRITWEVSYTIEYWVPPPEFLIQWTWAKVWNVTFLTRSQVMLRCSSRDHSLRTTSLGLLSSFHLSHTSEPRNLMASTNCISAQAQGFFTPLL